MASSEITERVLNVIAPILNALGFTENGVRAGESLPKSKTRELDG